MPESTKLPKPGDLAPETTLTAALPVQSPDLLQTLHQSIGNRAVGHLLGARMAPVQRVAATPEAPVEDEQTIRDVEAARGGGSALDAETRSSMETSLGQDFSAVRIHTDSSAEALSRSLNANAFTTGTDIFFRGGVYNPDSSSGRETIAHELTHVAQQSGVGTPPSRAVSHVDDPAEVEARSTASRVVGSNAETGSTDAGQADSAWAGSLRLGAAGSSRAAPGTHAPAHQVIHPAPVTSPAISLAAVPEELEDEEEPIQKDSAIAAGSAAESGDDPDSGSELRPSGVIQRLAIQKDGPAGAPTAAAPGAAGGKPSLEDRVSALEAGAATDKKKGLATTIDTKWHATFAKRLSAYRQVIYRLTNGFQTGLAGFTAANVQQAQQEALKDAVFSTILNVAAAGAAQPLLQASLGGTGAKLGKLVELIENPLVAAEAGATTTAGVAATNTRTNAVPPPPPAPEMKGAGDPLAFLSGNLAEIEKWTGRMEDAFSKRNWVMQYFTPEQWTKWDPQAQEVAYAGISVDMDAVTLPDPDKLESPDTLAVKIELYWWAAWIKANTSASATGEARNGLQVGSKIAARLKLLGVESLAGVKFDTTSWIFMDHEPKGPEFSMRLLNWANGWSQKLVKA